MSSYLHFQNCNGDIEKIINDNALTYRLFYLEVQF